MAHYFGRICGIERMPCTVNEFNFWIARGSHDKVEVGYIVTAEGDENDEKVFGLVTGIKFYTDAGSVLVDFLSHDFGDPRSHPPTDRQEILIATVSVIGSSKHGARPMTSGKVRLSTPKEIGQAYGMDRIDKKVFCGVVANGPDPDNWAPAFVDEKFLLGPEGAHLNISGASGLATKTSAAVFLLSSVLSAARKHRRKYAVVAFNVKGGDLLRLQNGGEDNKYTQSELLELLKNCSNDETRKMVELANECGIDLTFGKDHLKMFAPAKANDIKQPNSLVKEGIKPFYWSLQDVLQVDAPVRLIDLFASEDLDDKAWGVLARIEELLEENGPWADGSIVTFQQLIHRLATKQSKGFWDPHHQATVSKVTRHIRISCEGILRGLFAYDEEMGKDIKIENIGANELWIVDIEAINDRAKRLVFQNITSRLADLMEKESIRPVEDRRLHGIVVFVDELNKFAPSRGGGNTKMKSQIIELAARGRSLGIILFGAEQFASKIDREILGNASSHLLGRTEIVELTDKAYGWLPKDLRFIVGNLEKGRLLLRHATYGQPIFIKFPQPLHTFSTSSIDNLLNADLKARQQTLPTDEKELVFAYLKDALKGTRKVDPRKIYNDIKDIRKLGISAEHFGNWYRCWVTKMKFYGTGSNERKAINFVIAHFNKPH